MSEENKSNDNQIIGHIHPVKPELNKLSLSLHPSQFDIASIAKVAKWHWVRMADLKKCVLGCIGYMDMAPENKIKGNLEFQMQPSSLVLNFGFLMSSSDSFLKERLYTYVVPSVPKTCGVCVKDFFIDSVNFVADGRITQNEQFDDMLVSAGWAQSVLDLVMERVWMIVYNKDKQAYIAMMHDNTMRYIGRKPNNRYEWELRATVTQSA